MTMGATLGWPTATVLLGFLVMTGLVVALGTSSTARYEFERNGARERQRSDARSYGTHPAGSRARAAGPPAPGRAGAAPGGRRRRPSGPALATGGPGWWLVDEWAQALAGPFADRIDADWAALADGLPAVSVYGARQRRRQRRAAALARGAGVARRAR